MPDGRITRWLQRHGWLASVADSKAMDEIDQQVDHERVCQCEMRGLDIGDSGFTGGCQAHKAKPASTECEPHMHGYIRVRR